LIQRLQLTSTTIYRFEASLRGSPAIIMAS
jgi:hypothetical protein